MARRRDTIGCLCLRDLEADPLVSLAYALGGRVRFGLDARRPPDWPFDVLGDFMGGGRLYGLCGAFGSIGETGVGCCASGDAFHDGYC